MDSASSIIPFNPHRQSAQRDHRLMQECCCRAQRPSFAGHESILVANTRFGNPQTPLTCGVFLSSLHTKHLLQRGDESIDADRLLVDFFKAVEDACQQASVPTEYVPDETELDVEEEDDETPKDR